MSTNSPRRKRSDLSAGIQLPPGQISRSLTYLRRGDVLLRLALCLVAATVLWLATQGWTRPFSYTSGYIPQRDIVASIDFTAGELDVPENERRRQRARAQTICIYSHDVQPLVELREALKNRVFQVTHGEAFENLTEDERKAWQEFLPTTESMDNEEQFFKDFKLTLADDAELQKFERAVQIAFADFERDGAVGATGTPIRGGQPNIDRSSPGGTRGSGSASRSPKMCESPRRPRICGRGCTMVFKLPGCRKPISIRSRCW